MDDAAIGFTGVLVGALVTGVFSYFQNKQSINFAKQQKKQELLLLKYECMYKDLDGYYKYAQEISLLTINSIDTKCDITKLRSNLSDNGFIMYSMFYAPELSVQIDELSKALGKVIKSLSQLITNTEINRNEKEKLIGVVVVSSLELQEKIQNIQQDIARMAKQLINT
jgi:hypothetical protein